MFSPLDWTVLAAYFVVLFSIAVWVMRQKNESSTDYFLAGRHMGWFVIGASIFASNIGSEHIVGLAGTAMKSGLPMGHFELHSWLCLLLGWVFVPFYLRSRVFTMPEFLEKRYGPSARWLLSVTMLIGYVLTKISVTIYAGAIVCETLLGIEFWTGALVVLLMTGAYTVLGGMRAVLYTEALQAIVLLVGSLTVTIIGFVELGGWDGLVSSIEPEKFNMFRPASDPDYPWTGLVFAAPIIGLWYWCTDQYIVQRVLAARDEQQARRGTIFAAYLKMFPFFIFMFPGLIALALVNKGALVIDQTDKAFPELVMFLLPTGVRGLVAGGLLAALMSSLAAVFNSSSTLFTMDIYKKLRPAATEADLVRTGKIVTVVLVCVGIAWIPVLIKLAGGGLYRYLQDVQASIAPPIAAVFFLGLFLPRLNAIGALSALIVGFVLGMGRFTVRAILERPDDAGFLISMNFLHFAILLFVVCVVVLIAVSYATPGPREEQIRGLTFATTPEEHRQASRRTWNAMDVAHSVFIVLIILAIFFVFSPLGVG